MTRTDPSGAAAADAAATRRAGIYVHVPYCRHRCHFCAFLVTTHQDSLQSWVAGIDREVELRAPDWDLEYDSVYFGGGTPSSIPRVAILAVLRRLRDTFRIAADAEVTLEANPEDADPADLDSLRRNGVNRLSLGVQSFHDEDLRFLTRIHTGRQGEEAIRAARASGFENLTVDLMYGLPGRPRARLLADLDRLIDLAPDHVSAYQLTIEPGTPFSARRRRGDLVPLDEEAEREVFLLVRERLEAAGYRAYEVSSFARAPRFESRHNRKYWIGAPYLGLGPAAHSFVDPVRTRNHGGVRRWAAALEAGELPFEATETLTSDERRLERLFLGLRTAEGIDLAAFPGLAEARADLLARLESEGKLRRAGSRVRLTPEGMALADGVADALRHDI